MRLRPDSVAYTLFLSALGGVTPLSIDMGLPALIYIGTALHVSPALAGLTLSFFLTGIALGPVVLGPLSDRFGRRPVLLVGSLLFTLASVGCFLAQSLPVLLFWRFLAGVGAGAGSTLSLAIVRDLFDGATARAKLSYVSTVGTLAPMIAPSLGTLILAWTDWRGIYALLASTGLGLLMAISFGFSETLKRPDLTALVPRRLILNYGRVFRNPICLGYTLIASLGFACMFSYISNSPLVMMGVLGVSPTFYGWTFAATALGIMAGAFMNGRLSSRGIAGAQLLTFGLVVSVLSAFSLVLLACIGWEHLYTVLPLLILNTFCVGFISPNASQGVMHPLPDIAGVASAVLGSVRMLLGAIAGGLVALCYDGHSIFAMSGMMSLFSVAALTVYLALVRPIEKKSHQSSQDSHDPDARAFVPDVNDIS